MCDIPLKKPRGLLLDGASWDYLSDEERAGLWRLWSELAAQQPLKWLEVYVLTDLQGRRRFVPMRATPMIEPVWDVGRAGSGE